MCPRGQEIGFGTNSGKVSCRAFIDSNSPCIIPLPSSPIETYTCSALCRMYMIPLSI